MIAEARTSTASVDAAPKLSPIHERIVLCGFMGAGKTTAGRLLAAALGWAFLDLDEHIEARTGESIASLFRTVGEERFRRIESAALANALGQTATVIALGGGTPEALTNRLLLEQTPGTTTVFLDAPFPVLFDRCMLQTFAAPENGRPLLASPDEARARFTHRQPLYRGLAQHTVDVSEEAPDATSAAILTLLLPIGRRA